MFIDNHAIERISPISPIRLYKTACIAAVFASERAYHHPINKKDIIPTPSHPINSWNILLAETRIIIASRKVKRYLKNRLISLSECIYQIANSKIDHVTKSAIGVNKIEYWSSLMLDKILKLWMVIHEKLIVVDCRPWFIKISRGKRLRKKEYLTEIITLVGHIFLGFIKSDKNKGSAKVISERINEELNINIRSITFTWGCTENFWFLRPMDCYYPLKVRRLWILTAGADN